MVKKSQAFIPLEEGKCFSADFTTNRIFLQADEVEAESLLQTQNLAKITWQAWEMTKVLEGVRQVSLLVSPSYSAEKHNAVDAQAQQLPPPKNLRGGLRRREVPFQFESKATRMEQCSGLKHLLTRPR